MNLGKFALSSVWHLFSPRPEALVFHIRPLNTVAFLHGPAHQREVRVFLLTQGGHSCPQNIAYLPTFRSLHQNIATITFDIRNKGDADGTEVCLLASPRKAAVTDTTTRFLSSTSTFRKTRTHPLRFFVGLTPFSCRRVAARQ